MRILLISLAAFFVLGTSCFAQSKPLAKISVDGLEYYGMPLAFNGKEFALMDPAGKLRLIPTTDRKALEIVSPKFRSYTPDQIRQLLQSEFGSRYDITTSKRFVVVHAWGSASSYVQPFEILHDRFVKFVESNGVKLNKLQVPLVAAVLRSRNDFNRYLINEVQIKDSKVFGYYSSATNRITTYDPSGRLRQSNDAWIFNNGSIIHEAVHQSAFNTGLHNRFSPPPKWVSEGLATLFEARGFSDPEQFPKRVHRVNKSRLPHLRKMISQGKLYAQLLNLIDNDRIFEKDIESAYALSWGLSFYLYETAPERYFKFMVEDAKRKDFVAYTSNQRLKKFAKAFGNDFDALTANLTKLFNSKQPSINQ